MGIKTIPFFTAVFFISFWSLAQSPQDRYRELDGLIGQNSFFNNHLTGFMLYDLDSQTVQFEKNSHLYFIPASTTKILTFFASLLVLGDSSTLLRYIPKENNVIIWGTGDPSLYYHAASIPKPKINTFLARFKEIYFSDHNWRDEAFGYGWQWDDYNFSYSAEKSPLPLYGNLVTAINVNNRPHLSPSLFSVYQSDKNVRNVTREWRSNDFFYNPKTYNGMRAQIPFITSQKTFTSLASLEWGKVVHPSKDPLPQNHFVLKGVPMLSLYKEMMLESDNFIAEQLLLQVSDELFKELNTEKTIEYIQKTYLFDLPDKPQWVDGSGLSRHNLVTPRSLITVLEKIYRLLPDEEISQIFPVGGKTGTLKNAYYAPTPYVIAKTGTISNNHSLAGFIKTRTNKTYAFALMNNNYPYKATLVRREIEKVLLYIRDNF